MRLTTVLALMCFAQTVLSAPAVDPRHVAKANAASKNTLSDPLELELQGVHQQDQPIRAHSENEAVISSEEKETGDNDDEPEVKRSERVSTEDVDPHGEDLDGLSDNLEAADQDVKSVLRVFLHSLKQHPEIVEDIMEKEGEKLMGHPLAQDSDNSDPTAFQEPSPQLTKIPKQVEKKAGGEFPRFIYKSPMRNAFERNQMTAGSINNDANPPVQPAHNEVPVAETPLVDPHDVNEVKATDADLSNAIPVLQQPNSNQDTLEDQIHVLPSQPEQSGPIDITALQQAQDEYSRENPFINSLPLFPEHKDQQESQVEDIVEPDQGHSQVQPSDSDAPENDIPHLQDTEIVNTDVAPEEESDVIKEGGESEEKRSQAVLKSGEESKDADTEVKSEEEDDEAQETGSMPTEAAEEESIPNSPQAKPPHHLTGSEIAANMLHNPVESESSVPYYYYYYDYNKDGEKVPSGNSAASEEGEHEEEELENISDQNRPTDVESETDDVEGDDEEHADSEGAEEEETDGDDESEDETEDVDEEEQDGDEDTGDNTEDDEAHEDDEGEEEDSDTEEEENDLDEEEEEDHDGEAEDVEEDEEADDESDESTDKTNSHKVIAVDENSLPEPTNVFIKQSPKEDKNEADLLSLKAEAQDASNRPDGPAM
ncbi:protein starmaker-like isoform X2 [Haliotis asinina]|uniref:protein starmaker-like isoform X2 n=1 Tax=Haliotis asinina TaxID=109174 RepID=UPI003532644E